MCGASFGAWATTPYREVACHGNQCCALRETDDLVHCWGTYSTPLPGPFETLGVGNSNGCGVNGAGVVSCWGDNTYGQSTPPPGTFASLSGGEYHMCGLTTDGAAICWGRNDQGQCDP